MTKSRSLWQILRPKLAFCKRHLVWLGILLRTPPKKLLRFRCNICGHRSAYPRNQIMRDIQSCHFCGSHVRWRSVIHALSLELFGKSLALPDFPYRPDILGVGLSDWEGYASRLAKKLQYTNTFYHQEPFLDITDIGPAPPQYDFLISSDVFEHVCQPVERVFQNAYKLLKPGGLMILTVPYVEGRTTEHFPRRLPLLHRPGGVKPGSSTAPQPMAPPETTAISPSTAVPERSSSAASLAKTSLQEQCTRSRLPVPSASTPNP